MRAVDGRARGAGRARARWRQDAWRKRHLWRRLMQQGCPSPRCHFGRLSRRERQTPSYWPLCSHGVRCPPRWRWRHLIATRAHNSASGCRSGIEQRGQVDAHSCPYSPLSCPRGTWGRVLAWLGWRTVGLAVGVLTIRRHATVAAAYSQRCPRRLPTVQTHCVMRPRASVGVDLACEESQRAGTLEQRTPAFARRRTDKSCHWSGSSHLGSSGGQSDWLETRSKLM